ncbi:endolysin [Staphylococcus phage CF5]|uniref:Endolysin n=1 Tax=Staphylococcus phage CF5 TaxID=3113739 RepID=A0AAX4J7Z1_9CAUD|nr:endolysin [Staphylococcus phage CF5]
MDKRGYNPKSIVLHNDAGGMTGFQYKQNLQYAGYDRWARGVAHSYISEGQVWQAIGESRVAWHVA